MKNICMILLFQLPLSCLAGQSLCVPTQYDEIVEFASVIDGDTIKLADDRDVRLIGIDAPDIDRDYPELSEPFANQARQFLQQHLQPGQKLNLAFDRKRLDPKGKTLAYAYTEDGIHLQELMLSNGYAKARVYQNDYFWQCLEGVERQARNNRVGLWQFAQYQPMTVDQITRDDLNRWREIRGVVTGFERKGQHIWLIIDEKFYVGIPREESGKFNNILNLNLLESPVIVRGELYYSYKKWQLISYHPSQIGLQNTP
ncbi:thermonuclease family protein [Shewanella psychrotolerans]|uniref:thermonuclease family protein n=1 Tax=Shewanella psychrotolerans TaxID=2864206 RepID=UPI001C65B89E|nr:thermonuclease family protein [Shewanella psychrotolerans]QYK01115.1 thermonuclease family protein [Shewanella psychrotolerans]